MGAAFMKNANLAYAFALSDKYEELEEKSTKWALIQPIRFKSMTYQPGTM